MKKNEQRTLLKEKRREMSKEEVAEKSRGITEKFSALDDFKSAKTVFLYISLPKEVSTAEIIEKCLRLGKTVLVPITVSGEISLCRIDGTESLVTGEFGISEPRDKTPWQGEIDIAVIPGLGFDRQGGRMGFGKGCYDKFLAKNPCKKVGLCFGNMLQSQIITEEHDIAMDMVITEAEVIYNGGNP